MEHRFHVTVFDMFHWYDPDESWVAGHYETAEEAIADVMAMIDRELAHFWDEVCRQDKGVSTLEKLISQYESFAEHPVAFDSNNREIFDGMVYMKASAAEVARRGTP